jgi:hypothetical protein
VQVSDPGANNLPVLQEVDGLQAAPGQQFIFDAPGSDPDNDPLQYFLVDNKNNLVGEYEGFKTTPDGRVTWTVPAGVQPDGQTRSFSVHVQDKALLPASQIGDYTRTYEVTIVEDQPPAVSLSVTSFRPEVGEVVGFTVLATDDGGPPDLRLTLSELPAAWNMGSTKDLAISPNGVAQFTIPAGAPNAVIKATATAIDSAGHVVSSAPIELRIRPVDNSFPIIDVQSPIVGQTAIEIREATDVIGRIYDPDNLDGGGLEYYSLRAIPVDGGAPTLLLEVGELDSQNPIDDVGTAALYARIVTLSPLELPNGAYDIEIFAQDISGKSTSQTIPVVIDSDVKLGT